MAHSADPPPRLIALDWGTTSLRAWLLGDGGAIIDSATRPWGIMAVPDGDFAKALATITAPWTHEPLPILASGMIGSALGWREIPYEPCPAGVDELVAALRRQRADGTPLPIVPGLTIGGPFPDVMRGEETQIAGALELLPALREHARLILPGTHSKWVTVRDGAIVAFTTHITGELFAVLGKHSILGRPALAAGKTAPDSESSAAFEQGVAAIRDNPSRGLGSMLFSARTLVLTHRMAPEVSLDYLSGLLIGDELRNALPDRTGSIALALIGEAALCEHYVRALALFGVAEPPVIASAAVAGLWRIARAAALISP
jgi:2-dehydro-3-deoxygalactonokinase